MQLEMLLYYLMFVHTKGSRVIVTPDNYLHPVIKERESKDADSFLKLIIMFIQVWKRILLQFLK